MRIIETEKHQRELQVFISREELEGIIERAIAEKTGLPALTLRACGKLKIEPNMVGSPEYQSGYKASLSAVVQLPPAAEPQNLPTS